MNKFVRKGRKERKSCEGLRWDQRVRAGGLPETYLRNICPLPPSPTSPSYHFVSSESVLFRHRLFLFRCTYGCSLSRWAAQGPHWEDDDGGGGGKGAGSGGDYYTSMIFNPICLPAYLTTASNGGSMKSSMYMLIISCLTPRPSVSYLSSFTSTCHHLLLLSLILINGVAVIYKRMSTSMIPFWTWYHIFSPQESGSRKSRARSCDSPEDKEQQVDVIISSLCITVGLSPMFVHEKTDIKGSLIIRNCWMEVSKLLRKELGWIYLVIQVITIQKYQIIQSTLKNQRHHCDDYRGRCEDPPAWEKGTPAGTIGNSWT